MVVTVVLRILLCSVWLMILLVCLRWLGLDLGSLVRVLMRSMVLCVVSIGHWGFFLFAWCGQLEVVALCSAIYWLSSLWKCVRNCFCLCVG